MQLRRKPNTDHHGNVGRLLLLLLLHVHKRQLSLQTLRGSKEQRDRLQAVAGRTLLPNHLQVPPHARHEKPKTNVSFFGETARRPETVQSFLFPTAQTNCRRPHGQKGSRFRTRSRYRSSFARVPETQDEESAANEVAWSEVGEAVSGEPSRGDPRSGHSEGEDPGGDPQGEGGQGSG